LVKVPWLTQQMPDLDAITSSLPEVYGALLRDLVEHRSSADHEAGRGTLVGNDNCQGVIVERGYVDEASAVPKLTSKPMYLYAYLDGLSLDDSKGPSSG